MLANPDSQKLSNESTGTASARQRIVTKARSHFLAHGFRGVTMDDLAVDLGMSKKTLYTHFRSKDALVVAVIEDKMAAIDADMEEIAVESSTHFSSALHHLLAVLLRHSGELQPPFLRDMAREVPELFSLVQARRHATVHRHFGTIFSEGCKAGLIRKDITVDLMIEILISAMDGLVNPQKLVQLNLSAEICLSAIVRIFLEGVVTLEGRKKL
jgi:TetR/AcrR family transcriptional regulator, cholesterol catabolism regulator